MEELQLQLVALQNRILDLESKSGKGEFSNATISNKEVTVARGGMQSQNFVHNSTGWRLTPTDGEFNFKVSADALDIPDTTTANSFHVDVDGNTWWGSTAIGSAIAKILNTGVATFTNGNFTTSSGSTRIEINGTDNALYYYNGGNIQLGINATGIFFNRADGVGSASIQGFGTNDLLITIAGSSAAYHLRTDDFYQDSGATLGATSPWSHIYSNGTIFADGKLRLPVGTNLF